MVTESTMTVNEFIDSMDPSGVYIIATAKAPTKPGRGSHLTCSVDGTLFDSWDSSNQYVSNYYVVSGVSHEFTDISDHMSDLFQEGKELIETLGDKYLSKYNLAGALDIVDDCSGPLKYKLVYYVAYDEFEGERNKTLFDIEIYCVFSPTMTVDDARKKMIQTIKTRMYDRFYEFNKKQLSDNEGARLFEQAGYKKKKELYLTTKENRFVNSLPGWCKPFLTQVYVSSPGYYDSYEIRILPIPGDHRMGTNAEFYGDSSDMVKKELERYKSTFDRPGNDYDIYDEY